MWELYVPAQAKSEVASSSSEQYDTRTIPESFFNDADTQQQIQRTIQMIEQKIQSEHHLNSAYDDFVNMVTTEMDKKLPVKRKGGNYVRRKKSLLKPYWNEELQREWDLKVEKEREWLKQKACNNQKVRLRAVYCEQRRRFDRLNRRFKREYQMHKQKELADMQNDGDKRLFWKEIGKIGIHKERKVPIPWEVVTETGEVVSDKEVVLERWKNDFKKLYNDENNATYDEDHFSDIRTQVNENTVAPENVTEHAELDSPITYTEVRQSILRSKLKKAPGIDELPSEVLKNEACIKVLYEIISKAFELGVVPAQWQKAIVNPIPKPGTTDNRNPLNYRGISLISVPCKVYCDILNKRLSSWLEENDLLNEEQNGFRKNRSCLDHLYTLKSIISNRKEKRKSTFVCYIDIRKAFDNVNRICLWYKLLKTGIAGKFLKAVQSLYQEMQCAVRINGTLSDWFSVERGVRQGCLLSPTLFAIYVDDLATEIKQTGYGVDIGDRKVNILMFADDIALMADSEAQLQEMLNVVESWSKRWRLLINPDKSKIVHYRPKSQPRSRYQFTCGTHELEYTKSYKYLGMWLDEHMEMKETVKVLAASASRALGVLMGKFYDAGGMSYSVYTSLYKSLVLPIMLYGSAIWGIKEFTFLNTVQNKACRGFTCMQ